MTSDCGGRLARARTLLLLLSPASVGHPGLLRLLPILRGAGASSASRCPAQAWADLARPLASPEVLREVAFRCACDAAQLGLSQPARAERALALASFALRCAERVA